MATSLNIKNTPNATRVGENEEIRKQMNEFWIGYTANAGVKEMMLDTKAEEYSDAESEEILNFLPEYEGKDVLELGAGIGRFTDKLSASAKSVIAVDFMEKFLEKNKEMNAVKANITFLCKDVMDLQMPENSLDFVFSNWLFMYLSDKDLEILIKRMVCWLRPNGRLFFRESCFMPCGDNLLSYNPTIYRSRKDYNDLITSIELKKNDGKPYGLNIITSKPVQFYIKVKNNPNQICWLVESAERDSANCQGFATLQKFLDEMQYSRTRVSLYEEMCGKDFVSVGGHRMTKEFCTMLGLKREQKVLDVGCGIGGSAFHVAKEYEAEVIGIDLSVNMVEIANERHKEQQVPKVSFEIADTTKVQYPGESFDVIYSCDTIMYVERKDLLFQTFFKWLKPGGKLLIIDYVCGPHENKSQDFKEYVAKRCYHLLTVEQYKKTLENAGGKNVKAEDKTEFFVENLKNELLLLTERKEDLLKTSRDVARELYDTVVEQRGFMENSTVNMPLQTSDAPAGVPFYWDTCPLHIMKKKDLCFLPSYV